jgi:hypothetical protein
MRALVLPLLLLGSITLPAAEKTHALNDFRLEKYVSGPRVTPAFQKGKGTLMLFWVYELETQTGGQNLKVYQKIHDKLKDDLVVIGIEDVGQYGATKNLTALLKKAGVEYTVYSGCKMPFKNTLYPYMCVFNREGKLVFNGNPTNSQVVEEALKEALLKPEEEDKESKEKKGAEKKDAKKSA